MNKTLGWSVGARFARWAISAAITVVVFRALAQRWDLPWLWATALAVGFGLVVWAVRVNRFFSSVVRIQTERGHQLVTAGPYGWVRHPGYLGMLLGYSTIGLAIGSWWAVLPGIGSAAVVLRRARIEDGYLLQHLEGYRQYAVQVRYRLVPGVW